MFQLEQIDPDTYRQKTRKSSFILIIVFASLAMSLASLFVIVAGNSGGSNFKLNLAGVLSGLVVTLILVKFFFSKQPFMYEAAYSWKLKRNLMRITNVMHQVKELSLINQPEAVQLLNFYYLALAQMHRLEGNDPALLEIKVPAQAAAQKMLELGLNPENNQLQDEWFHALKKPTTTI